MAHDHPHEHHHHDTVPHSPPRPDLDDGITHWRAMEIAVRELLIQKGHITPEEIHKQVEDMDSRTPALGARVVARAWADADFKARLLTESNDAVESLGIDRGVYKLVVVENTRSVHNLVVCTLCSCYPRWLLGLPPDWYKSRNYRSRAINEPRAVLQEFGTAIPDDMVIRVHDSTADMRYLVLPRRPEGSEGWSEERLAGIVTRDCMIGVSVPRVTS